MLFIGRFLEGLILQIQIYKFFFSHHDRTDPNFFSHHDRMDPNDFMRLCFKGLTQNKWTASCFVFLSMYMLAHSLSVPALGIALEIRTGRETDCRPYVYEYHTVYWILDVFRYLYDVAIRLLMVLAMLAIGCIWDEDEHIRDEDEGKEPESYREYLEDRVAASKDYSKRWKLYIKKGERVKHILEIFKPWFVLPWILFFISSSLSTDQILQSWNDSSSSNGKYNFAEASYMVYNFNQLFLLALPYLCSKMMNMNHSSYVYSTRIQQLGAQKTASRAAFAHMSKIEEEGSFHFVPRVWGTSIKIELNSPLYIILLLLGIFFTFVDALL